MAIATTASYDQLVLETSEDGSTWTKICGIADFSIRRAANIDRDEIPDCADESLPHYVEKAVRSTDVTISGTGKWAQESNDLMTNWFYSGAQKRVRVSHSNAASGEVEIESGMGLLTQLDHARVKGVAVSAELTIEVTGTVTLTDAA